MGKIQNKMSRKSLLTHFIVNYYLTNFENAR